MRIVTSALVGILLISGCEGANNAAIDRASTGGGAQSKSKAPAPPPFTLKMEGNIAVGSIELTSKVDALAVRSITVNRGNCGLRETLTFIDPSDLRENEVGLEGPNFLTNDPAHCPWTYRITKTGEEFKSCGSPRPADVGKLEADLRKMGKLGPGMRIAYRAYQTPHTSGQFYVTRIAVPAALRFAERLSISLECAADHVVEVSVETDRGTYTFAPDED